MRGSAGARDVVRSLGSSASIREGVDAVGLCQPSEWLICISESLLDPQRYVLKRPSTLEHRGVISKMFVCKFCRLGSKKSLNGCQRSYGAWRLRRGPREDCQRTGCWQKQELIFETEISELIEN